MHHHWTRPRRPNFGHRRDLGHPAEHRFGTASSRGWTCNVDDKPVGFCPIFSGKVSRLGFYCRNLHAFGWADDPTANIKHAPPFLASRREPSRARACAHDAQAPN
jgi:hypothetical protein